jgi:hypothetical protein
MEFKLTQKQKYSLFRELIKDPLPFKHINNENLIMDFLSEIWDLYTMPSVTDNRFQNAYGEINQHIVNNSDWEFEYLFVERLELLKGNEKFRLFLETLINAKYQNSEDIITHVLGIINRTIKEIDFSCVLSDYSEVNGLPIYRIVENELDNAVTLGIKLNRIPFFVDKNPSGRSDRRSSHKKPTIFPSFALVFNSGWNDYGYWTSFNLFYYKNDEEQFNIGPLKIQYQKETHTEDHIDSEFTELPIDYCSLGQESQYYLNLKEILENEFMSVLYALKDAAFFTTIQERFDNTPIFINSLIRGNYQERLLREAKHLVYSPDLKKLYHFEYQFKPCFSKATIPIKFEFEREGILPRRIYALIGQNGTGKTQFITSLPLDLSKKKHELFNPIIPLFSKVIAVSYSAFDNFKIPKKTAEFNYVYCGLRDENGDLFTPKQQALRFHNAWKKIKADSRFEKWVEILSNFLQQELLEELIIKDDEGNDIVNVKEFSNIKTRMSSGQTMMLYVISDIVANIRFDSLLLYDEPETHLHPNAISQLINTIQQLVTEFQSYCIITTHSPLIIRELFSKSVYIVEKKGDVLSVRNIEIESYGENLGILNDIVFGNREVPKFYRKTIRKLVREGLSYEQIIELLESDQIPMSLNMRIFIKSQTLKK